MTNHHRAPKPLTPHQEAKARARAYDAYLEEMVVRHPKPEPCTRDLVHDNKHVARALTGAISLMPVFLAVICISSMVISADKTFKAFSSVAAHPGTIWASLVGALGVVLTEGSMVYVAFAATRQRLQKDLPRRVFTLPSLWRGIKVRLGLVPVPDYDEMPDTSLQWFSRMVFVLVLAANIFTATMPILESTGLVLTPLDFIKLGFAIFMGTVAPFALHSVGAQLAQLSFDLYRQEQQRLKRELEEQWRAEMDRRWQAVEEELTRRALHRAFVVKNQLSLDAASPYLLTAGQDGEVAAVPFEPL